jgi:hypothetical protein
MISPKLTFCQAAAIGIRLPAARLIILILQKPVKIQPGEKALKAAISA